MSPHPQVQRASLLYEMMRDEEAYELIRRRLAEDPDDHHAWSVLGQCLITLGRPSEALAAAIESLRLEPQYLEAHFVRGVALRHLGRLKEAEAAQREAIRIDPYAWGPRRHLAELLLELAPDRPEDALEQARTAVRIGPDVTYTWQTMYKVASFHGRTELADEAVRELIRVDPTHTLAVTVSTEREAARPGTSAARAADMYASGLAAAPESEALRTDLDKAVYRMLRGTRWLALLCLVMAGVTVDIFPTEGEEPKDLPIHLGTRLWALALMAAVWGFGALRRYLRMRTGAKLTVRDLVRRLFWPRVVLGQATLATLCALVMLLVPWTDRTIPQVLFWLGLVPNLLSITHDRDKV
ncbi:tetratricopeptide repeat protein [Streptomyces sp. Je 1-79]|uniref:tetratricopeptide repeat protein n=1 Tax=Streptomyces sp. Je 1-79 TaxID=2943847 RepID=UPI0021A4618C|nr:tetratricopeptide repeat protein [Streptomyces sp. Je 1-79]MCT4352747.1 tetratricopeptide repeat protein [Streptomyces sp. Je 1-79]